MAKSKSTKSSSATIGFEQQIWDAACELWGHIRRIASALKQAMNDYTVRDRQNYGEMDVAKRAFPKF